MSHIVFLLICVHYIWFYLIDFSQINISLSYFYRKIPYVTQSYFYGTITQGYK